MSVELPRRLGSFLLLRHLASGGMGEVYLAHQSLGVGERLCVVKTVRGEYAESDAAMRRFLDEARTMSLLSHKNVAAVLDVGTADQTAFIAVEHVAGRDLHAVFQRSRRLKRPVPEDVALYVIAELLDALAYVHRATDPRTGDPLNIVHRDVSPHNVMVSFEGEVKLIDFGVARSAVKTDVTQTGQAVGKIRYMAPEQARAQPTDGTTDVYAACIVAVELLTGRRFYGDMSMEALWTRVAGAEAHVPPGFAKLPAEVQRVLLQGLAADRSERPSASELKERLVAVQMKRGTLGSSDGLREHLASLFHGAQEEERRARALLLQEPTSVHAALLPSATAIEETPADDLLDHVEPDAPTDSQLDTRGMLPGKTAAAEPSAMRVVRDEPMERTPKTVPGEPRPPATSTALKRRKQRQGSLAMAAGIALPLLLGLGIAIGLIVQHGTPAPVVAAPIDELDRPRPPPPDVDPPPPPPPIAVVLAPPPVVPIVSLQPPPAPPTEEQRPRRATPKKVVKRPKLFGDRVRALRGCKPAPVCAKPVLARAGEMLSLSAEELKALEEDVDWCLQQCR